MTWLRKLREYFSDGPEWRVIVVTYLIAAGVAGASGAFAENRWLMFFDTLLAGWCLHGAVSTRIVKFYRDAWQDTSRALHEMHELNKAMIEDRVRMHLAKVEVVETDDEVPAKTIN